jgi:hypothetical protein
MSVAEDGWVQPAAAAVAVQRALDTVSQAHPDVDLQVVGLSPDDAEAAGRVIQMLRAEQPTTLGLLDATLARVFRAPLDEVGRFVAVLRAGLPDDTRIYMRGSAVNGQSYETASHSMVEGLGPATWISSRSAMRRPRRGSAMPVCSEA